MGGGIAMVLANAGLPVLLKEADQAALDRGLTTIQLNYANSVSAVVSLNRFAEERLKRITPTLTYDDFSSVDLVIEAVFEGMALKKEIFKELDRVCKPGAILASNTSTLSIDEIASSTSRPDFVIGTHFFSPANVMRLLEIVRGKDSSKEVIALHATFEIARQGGVLVGNCRGFVGNRMLPLPPRSPVPRRRRCGIEAVDQALSGFRHGYGALGHRRLAGLRCRLAHPQRIIAIWKYPTFVNRLPKIAFVNSAGTARKPAQAGTSTTISAVRRRTPS